MIRKALTILSLLGLLLSAGLWGASYVNVIYGAAQPSMTVGLCFGTLSISIPRTTVRGPYYLGSRGLDTNWTGKIIDASSGRTRIRHFFYGDGVIIPLWIPTLISSVLCLILHPPFYRRRKRKKLGLCLGCGYDLRASKDRCPECGMPRGKP